MSLLPALLAVPWSASLPGHRLNKLGVSGRKLSCKLCARTAPVGTGRCSGPWGHSGALVEAVVRGIYHADLLPLGCAAPKGGHDLHGSLR